MGKSSLAADSDFRHVRPITFQRASPTAMQKKTLATRNCGTVTMGCHLRMPRGAGCHGFFLCLAAKILHQNSGPGRGERFVESLYESR